VPDPAQSGKPGRSPHGQEPADRPPTVEAVAKSWSAWSVPRRRTRPHGKTGGASWWQRLPISWRGDAMRRCRPSSRRRARSRKRVMIHGVPGNGKTRLVEELRGRAEAAHGSSADPGRRDRERGAFLCGPRDHRGHTWQRQEASCGAPISGHGADPGSRGSLGVCLLQLVPAVRIFWRRPALVPLDPGREHQRLITTVINFLAASLLPHSLSSSSSMTCSGVDSESEGDLREACHESSPRPPASSWDGSRIWARRA